MEDHQYIKSNPPLGMLQPNHWNIQEFDVKLLIEKKNLK